MKKSLTLLAILISLICSPGQVFAWTKAEILDSLLIPRETTVGYFVTLKSKDKEFSVQTLRKNMKDDPQNPLWYYLFAEENRSNDDENPAEHFAKANELYTDLAKQRALTSEEVVCWTRTVEYISGIQAGINLAQGYENKVTKNRQKVYQCLATLYCTKFIYVMMGIKEDPGKNSFKADFDNILKSFDRWRNSGILPDIQNGRKTMNTAKDYASKAEAWPDFGQADYADQGDIETTFGFVNVFMDLALLMDDSKNKSDAEIDNKAKDLIIAFFSSETGIFRGYSQKAYAEAAKTDPQIQAAIIFFNILKSLKKEDMGNSNRVMSPESKQALESARNQYREMIKSQRTRAYGYDGLVTLDNIEQKVTKNTREMAKTALSYDCTAINSFAYLANQYFDEGNYSGLISIARKKADKDHSAQAYFMLICAYLAKKDCKTVDKFVKEIEPYYDYWPKQMQTKIDIAFATACILQGEYKNSSILLFDYSKSLSKIEHNRTVCLYNLAVALYLNNQKDDVLIILNELDKQDNPQYIKLNSALLRSQVYIDKPNPYTLK